MVDLKTSKKVSSNHSDNDKCHVMISNVYGHDDVCSRGAWRIIVRRMYRRNFEVKHSP